MNGAHVALIGRVTRPGELKYASTGTAMLRVGVMVDDPKRREGDPPEFADVTIWSERAEELAERLPKGTNIYIEGKATVRPWLANDGTPRASLNVSAWKAEPMGQIGRQAPRRGPVGEPVALGAGHQVGAGRNLRGALGLEDDLDGWPE
jgi:single-strand DNA-binding protein